jgi:hypothetical protein
MTVGFVAFLVNILMTLGWKNLVELVKPEQRVAAAAQTTP